jgi:hypothetical protein
MKAIVNASLLPFEFKTCLNNLEDYLKMLSIDSDEENIRI